MLQFRFNLASIAAIKAGLGFFWKDFELSADLPVIWGV